MKGNILLLLAAMIWGFAFVAQRVGMEHVGPFTFNAVRFALGSLSLLPLIFLDRRSVLLSDEYKMREKNSLRVGLVAGGILFIGASLQQIGLVYTTAGKSAFITCLYIIMVPIAGVFLKQKIAAGTWIGSALAVAGLFLLCVKTGFGIAYGDLLELLGAFFWTAHILLIDHFSPKVHTLQLACSQFIICSLLSLIAAVTREKLVMGAIVAAGVPILYGGVFSVGIAYTLQIAGQKQAAPSHAAIILSMETVFAAIGGYLLLGERLGPKELLGCFLMMGGMLLSQVQGAKPNKREKEAGACS
jgi:drug/metabolite transporter (DMT)-like permease